MFELNATLPVFLLMFIIFMMALNNMVLKPIGATIERRQGKIKGDIQAGSEARAKAAELVSAYEAQMHDTRTSAQAIVNDVLNKATQARQAELKRIHDEGQLKLQEAKKEIAAERTALIGQLADEERSLVATIVGKLLGDSAKVFVDAEKARQVLVEEAS